MKSITLLSIVALCAGHDSLIHKSASAGELTPARLGDSASNRFSSIKGRIRIEGTSNLDDWRVETKSIGGLMQVWPGFPNQPTQTISVGPGDAWAEVFINARSLKSIEKDGKPFSNKMDEIMYEAMKAPDHPRIVYRLNRLTLKAGAKTQEDPYSFDAQGQLVVAGVTNEVSMAVNVLPLGGNQLKVWGTTTVKMTDYHIDPPAPRIALGLIKTGDEVKVAFEWVLASVK